MTVEYTNRTGKTYYLRAGTTKTGKPRYFFSVKPDGKGMAVDQNPEGFEVYEHPENAQVFLRKIRPQVITDIEQYLVKKALKSLSVSKRYRIDCKDEFLTIYESDVDHGALADVFDSFLQGVPLQPGMTRAGALDFLSSVTDKQYTAMLRFRLVDRERRTFTAERFCFRGAIDDWIQLQGPCALNTLVENYVKFLGTDAFYELPFA